MWAVFILIIWANLPLSSAAVVISEMIPAFASASVTFVRSYKRELKSLNIRTSVGLESEDQHKGDAIAHGYPE